MENRHFIQIEPVGPRAVQESAAASTASLPHDGAEHALPHIDFHLFCRLVDQLPELTDLRLQGRGEPLLHLHLFDMVRYAIERGMLVSITTGLTALSETRAQECVLCGLHQVRVVIDASTSPLTMPAPIHSRHLRVLRNLRRLMAARSRAQCLRPEIALTAVLNHRDLPRLSSLVRFARDEGIEDISVEIADDGQAGLASVLQSLRRRSAFGEAQKLAIALGVTLRPLHFVRDGVGTGPIHARQSAPGVSINHRGETCSFDVLPEPRIAAAESNTPQPSPALLPKPDALPGAAG